MDEEGRVHIVDDYAAYQFTPDQWEAMFEFAARAAGSMRIDQWLERMHMHGHVRVQVIGLYNYNTNSLVAHARVMFGGKLLFEHEEPYLLFPSDEFTGKILLVAG